MTHAPETEPGKRVTDAGARTDGRKALPSLSEVGAGCGKAARPVLGGGTGVTRFPTAIATSPSALVATKKKNPHDCAGRQWRLNNRQRTLALRLSDVAPYSTSVLRYCSRQCKVGFWAGSDAIIWRRARLQDNTIA